MKRILLVLLGFIFYGNLFADIAPNPIIVKGIYTVDSCKIQMVSEFVFAELYNDSAKVECTFVLKNFGESTTIQIGFPEMNFQHWSGNQYNETDKANFKIFVNGIQLNEDDIKVPAELENVYNKYMYIYYIEKEYKRKIDSIYKAYNITEERHLARNYKSINNYQNAKESLDSLNKWRQSKPYISFDLWNEFDEQMKKGNFPWYVWDVQFEKNENRVIKVEYSLPSGRGYGANYRYFKYILETGAGWLGVIEEAEIKVRLHDIELNNIETISPKGFHINREQRIISWHFKNLEPTSDDDIYIRYFNSNERKKWKKYQRKRKRAIFFRNLNPIYWFNN